MVKVSTKINSDWLTWNDDCVKKLALAFFTQPAELWDWGVLEVMADALEDAGCEDVELLTALRNRDHNIGSPIWTLLGRCISRNKQLRQEWLWVKRQAKRTTSPARAF